MNILLFLFKIVYNISAFSTRTGGITLKFEWDEDKNQKSTEFKETWN